MQDFDLGVEEINQEAVYQNSEEYLVKNYIH